MQAANKVMSGGNELYLEFWVYTEDGIREKAAAITFNSVFSFTALIDNMDVSLNVSQAKVNNVSASFCTWGTLSS